MFQSPSLRVCSRPQEILNATVHHRARFSQLTESGPLRAVPLANWAGLGAVRYIPAHLLPLMEAGVTDSGKEDINKLNTELLAKLKSTDSAFSLGKDGPQLADLYLVDGPAVKTWRYQQRR